MAVPKGRPVRFSPTVVLVLVVLALAAGALVPLDCSNPVPGTLRVGVLAAESPSRMDRALGPFANWVAGATGRGGEVVAPGTSGLEELERRADLMFVPEPQARRISAARILAWVRPVGRPGSREDLLLLHARDHGTGGVCGLAVADLIEETHLAEFDSVVVARSPFAERELLRAFVLGALDAVVVRASVVEDARGAGWLDDRPASSTTVAAEWPWLALVASSSLDSRTEASVRDAALNLDKYRLDPSHARAASVLHALAEIGIAGFAPVEPFAALRR